jgi:predicted RNase H-like HicB family nuclease
MIDETNKYLVVIEPSATGFGAWVPDLPGCVAVGDTVEETIQLMREAIPFHLDGMREDGLPIPEPSSVATVIEVEAA